MTMTKNRLKEIERLASRAPDGPWAFNESVDCVYDASNCIADIDFDDELSNEKREATGSFIAAARTAVPELLAYVREIEEKVTRLEEIRDAAEDLRLAAVERDKANNDPDHSAARFWVTKEAQAIEHLFDLLDCFHSPVTQSPQTPSGQCTETPVRQEPSAPVHRDTETLNDR